MAAASPPEEIAAGAASVGTRKTPLPFMVAMISSVRKIPCSMVVMPASIASAIPVEPWAWAAVRRPAFLASSMAARISSSVSWGDPGSTPGVITPPVAMSLITSAPALSCSRTALRTSSGPSASRHAHRAPRAEDARPREQSLGDCATHRELGIVAATQVAHGGHPGLHRLLGPPQGLEGGQRVGLVLHGADGIRLGAEAEVHVTVDETGQERATGKIDAPAPRSTRVIHHLRDPVSLDDHGPPAHGLRARSVDQRCAHQHECIHWEEPSRRSAGDPGCPAIRRRGG